MQPSPDIAPLPASSAEDDPWAEHRDGDAGAELTVLLDRYPDLVRERVAAAHCLVAQADCGSAPRAALRGIAHDLRGEGTSFGYPAVTRIAGSLGDLLKSDLNGPAFRTLAVEHLNALDQIARDRLGGDTAVAEAIAAALELRRTDLLGGTPSSAGD